MNVKNGCEEAPTAELHRAKMQALSPWLLFGKVSESSGSALLHVLLWPCWNMSQWKWLVQLIR